MTMVTAMPNLGQMSPEEKQAYLEYLKGLATQQKTSADASNQAQGQMDMARSGDVGLEFGNQAGAIIQGMLGQQGSAQMFAQKANQTPLAGMAQQDAERFAQHLKDQARLGDSMGQAKIHMGARQTDLTQKAELSEQERQQALMKMLAEQQAKKTEKTEERDFRREENAKDRASRSENARIMAALAGGRRDDAASAKASLVPEGWEFRDPKALKVVTEGYITKIQDASKAAGDVDALAKELEDAAVEAGGREALGTHRKIADSKYQGLILRLKELENLGVLQKLDVDALKKLVRNPLERSAEPNSTFENDLAQLKSFRGELKSAFERTMAGKGLMRSGAGSTTTEDTVEMLDPETGTKRPIFKSKVEDAKKKGFRAIDG